MSSIANVHIISSDETLLVMEACDQILSQAKKQGVAERNVVEVNEKYDWQNLLQSSQSLSLFSEIKLTDIRFSKTPNKQAQNALIELVNTANQENLLLIRLPKVEKRQKNTKWFKAISQNANFKELWPPRTDEFANWIRQRAQALNLQLDAQACARLSELTEGNLLAVKQALDKLLLLYPEQKIDAEMIDMVSSDSARYSVFSCLDEALAGHGDKSVKMLHKFQQEAVAPIMILFNLTREISLCQQIALAKSQGKNITQVLSKFYLWENKKRLITGAVNRLPLVVWQKLMIRCAFLDRMIKGQQVGNIWQEIELCLWMISGKKVW